MRGGRLRDDRLDGVLGTDLERAHADAAQIPASTRRALIRSLPDSPFLQARLEDGSGRRKYLLFAPIHAESVWQPGQPFGTVAATVDLRAIRLFICTAELGSVSRAAEAMNIVQPAVTRHIKRLEKELGVVLLTRLPRGVRLTTAGREFLAHCRRIEGDVALALQDLRHHQRLPRGPLAFGASPTLGTMLMPSIIARVFDELPHVSLRVVEARSLRLQEALMTGELDLAILTNPLGTNNLHLQPLTAEPLSLVERAAGRTPARTISLASLAQTPVVLTPGMNALAGGLHGGRRVTLSVRAEIDSIETIRCLVRLGRAKTISPASAFRDDLEQGHLRATPIEGADRKRALFLAWRSDNADEIAVREMVRIVSAEMAGIMGMEPARNGRASSASGDGA
jgi:LysR family transcriptional regulator, nitrogen assimilation regulatory protein